MKRTTALLSLAVLGFAGGALADCGASHQLDAAASTLPPKHLAAAPSPKAAIPAKKQAAGNVQKQQATPCPDGGCDAAKAVVLTAQRGR